MSPISPAPVTTTFKTLGALAVVLALAACAQPQQSAELYDSSRENTQRDAAQQIMGSTARAPSQIQLGFGETGAGLTPVAANRPATEGETATPAPTPRPLAEARSFLGTVPCPAGMACEASRFVVTLAPSGEWRARTTLLAKDQTGQVLAEQGCWEIIGDEPLRIALVYSKQDTAKADLSFVNGNTLRVNALNGVQPLLEHRLTRQADLDPIDELKSRPALACNG